MGKIITVKSGMLCGEVDLSKAKNKEVLFALFLAAGAIGNDISCRGIDLKNDKSAAIAAKIAEASGAKIIESGGAVAARMTANKKSVNADLLKHCEIVPAIALLCAFLKGESHIISIDKNEIFKKIEAEFNHLGILTKRNSRGLFITGAQTIKSDGAFAWDSATLAEVLILAASRTEGEIRLLGVPQESGEFKEFMKLYKKLDGGYKK